MQTYVNTGLLYMLGFFVLSSCDRIVDVKLPEHQPQLVANEFFTPDSMWTVRVSETVSYTDAQVAPSIQNASVEIWEGEQRIHTLPHLGGGIYGIDARPNAETVYTLRVGAQGFESTEGSGWIPANIEVSQIELDLPREPGGWVEKVDITLTLEDRPGVKDYYGLKITRKFREYRNGELSIEDSSLAAFSTQDLALVDEFFDVVDDGGEQFFVEKYFTDELFDGRSYDLDFAIPYFRAPEEFVDPNYRIEEVFYVLFSTLSEEMYTYIRTAEEQGNTREDPFAEPVEVFSNMDSGFGVFAGYQTQVIKVDPQLLP